MKTGNGLTQVLLDIFYQHHTWGDGSISLFLLHFKSIRFYKLSGNIMYIREAI